MCSVRSIACINKQKKPSVQFPIWNVPDSPILALSPSGLGLHPQAYGAI